MNTVTTTRAVVVPGQPGTAAFCVWGRPGPIIEATAVYGWTRVGIDPLAKDAAEGTGKWTGCK
jgi:hypothetical protein